VGKYLDMQGQVENFYCYREPHIGYYICLLQLQVNLSKHELMIILIELCIVLFHIDTAVG